MKTYWHALAQIRMDSYGGRERTGAYFLNYGTVFLTVIHHDILSLEFFPPISSWPSPTLPPALPLTLSPPPAPHLPLGGSSLHAAVAAVGLRLRRAAQAATGKP